MFRQERGTFNINRAHSITQTRCPFLEPPRSACTKYRLVRVVVSPLPQAPTTRTLCPESLLYGTDRVRPGSMSSPGTSPTVELYRTSLHSAVRTTSIGNVTYVPCNLPYVITFWETITSRISMMTSDPLSQLTSAATFQRLTIHSE